jgi:hypothetical protein
MDVHIIDRVSSFLQSICDRFVESYQDGTLWSVLLSATKLCLIAGAIGIIGHLLFDKHNEFEQALRGAMNLYNYTHH